MVDGVARQAWGNMAEHIPCPGDDGENTKPWIKAGKGTCTKLAGQTLGSPLLQRYSLCA